MVAIHETDGPLCRIDNDNRAQLRLTSKEVVNHLASLVWTHKRSLLNLKHFTQHQLHSRTPSGTGT
jgi:hypothetical protein